LTPLTIELFYFLNLSGGESIIAGREPLPEMKLEKTMMGDSIIHGEIPNHLKTPPHTITLDEHSFPTVEDNRNQQSNHLNALLNGPQMRANKKQRNVALSGLSHAYDDETTLMGNKLVHE
jgi:hypothetical protein